VNIICSITIEELKYITFLVWITKKCLSFYEQISYLG
jgi:hypothetical protein